MADMNVSVILKLIDKLTGPMRKVMGATKGLKKDLEGVKKSGGGAGLARQFSRDEVAARKLRLEMHRLKGSMAALKTHAKGLFGRGGMLAAGIVGTKAAMAGLAIPFIDTAKQFEDFAIRLRSAGRSAAQIEQDVAWITEFAAKTPFNTGQVFEGFVKLSGANFDPKNGLLKAAGDAAAANGKSIDEAVEAFKDAVTGENERLKEFLVTASSNSKTRKVTYSYVNKEGKQKNVVANLKSQKDVIEKLTAIFADKFGGSMDGLSQGWTGIVSNLEDFKTRFELMVMNGPFERLKGQLQGVLAQLQAWEKDGTLKAFATAWATNINEVIDKAVPILQGAWKALQAAAQWLQAMADAAGGWENLGKIAAALWLMAPALRLINSAGNVLTILSGIAGLKAGPLFLYALGIAAIAATIAKIDQQEPAMLKWAETLRPPAKPGEKRAPLASDIPADQFMMPGGRLAAGIGQALNEQFRAAWTSLKEDSKKIGPGFERDFVAPVKAAAASIALALKNIDWAGIAATWAARARGLASTITASVKAGLGSLVSAGIELMQGLWDGMKQVAANIMSWAAGIGASIRAAIMSQSPGINVETPSGKARGGPPRPAPAAGQTVNSGAKADPISTGRSMGGSIFKGETRPVGERGPELITAKRYGHVTPLAKLAGGHTVNVSLGGVTINGKAGMGELKRLADIIGQRVRASLHDGAYA